jgi:hypothetical protein
MEKLELKHLAAYLPYGLKIYHKGNDHEYPLVVNNNTVSLRGGVNINDVISDNDLKPILRPLSELDVDGEINTPEYIKQCSVSYYEHLLSNHFDIFGLIDKGLGIDINTIKN